MSGEVPTALISAASLLYRCCAASKPGAVLKRSLCSTRMPELMRKLTKSFWVRLGQLVQSSERLADSLCRPGAEVGNGEPRQGVVRWQGSIARPRDGETPHAGSEGSADLSEVVAQEQPTCGGDGWMAGQDGDVASGIRLGASIDGVEPS